MSQTRREPEGTTPGSRALEADPHTDPRSEEPTRWRAVVIHTVTWEGEAVDEDEARRRAVEMDAWVHAVRDVMPEVINVERLEDE